MYNKHEKKKNEDFCYVTKGDDITLFDVILVVGTSLFLIGGTMVAFHYGLGLYKLENPLMTLPMLFFLGMSVCMAFWYSVRF